MTAGFFKVNDYTTGLQKSVPGDCEAGSGCLVKCLSGFGADALQRRPLLMFDAHCRGTECAIGDRDVAVLQSSDNRNDPMFVGIWPVEGGHPSPLRELTIDAGLWKSRWI